MIVDSVLGQSVPRFLIYDIVKFEVSLFVCLFVCWFVGSFIRLFVRSFIHSLKALPQISTVALFGRSASSTPGCFRTHGTFRTHRSTTRLIFEITSC